MEFHIKLTVLRVFTKLSSIFIYIYAMECIASPFAMFQILFAFTFPMKIRQWLEFWQQNLNFCALA